MDNPVLLQMVMLCHHVPRLNTRCVAQLGRVPPDLVPHLPRTTTVATRASDVACYGSNESREEI